MDKLPKAKLTTDGWAVESSSAMTQALAELAGVTISNNGDTIVPYTRQLDSAVMQLIDALIHLRYDAGRVRLTLFDTEEVEG